MNRLTAARAVCAAALVLLGGCSSEEKPQAAAAPSSAPAAPSPSASADTAVAALCARVTEAKTALNEELKRVVTPDGRVPQAEGRKVMTGLAATLTDLAAAGDGEVAGALRALAAEATKAAGAADPVRAASGGSFAAAGEKVDNVCA